MKMLKRALSFCLSLALSATIISAAVVTNADAPTNTSAVSSSTVKILGRSFQKNGYTCFSYGNAGIDVNFSGTDFYIDVAQLDGLNPSTDIMVLVDTEMPMEATCYTVTSSTGWLRVASNLSNGNHFVKIMKKCRGIGAGGSFGTDYFGIRSIAVNEGGSILTPDAKSDLIIEAYGDSITNGDATWLNPDGSNSSYSWAAYSGVVARILDADVYTAGNTGNGLNSWCLGAGNLFPPRLCWEQLEPSAGIGQAPDHSQTDVVIINLGTNDMVAIGSDSAECAEYTEEAFKNSYISWMEDIHAKAPNAIVIGCLGAMGADVLFDDIQAACEYVNDEFGEEYAFFTPLANDHSIRGGVGYDNGHPSNYAHETYGLQIAKIIDEKLNLGKTAYLNSIVPVDTNLDASNIAYIAEAYNKDTLTVYGGTAVAGCANDANSSTGWQLNTDAAVIDDVTLALTDCWLAFKWDSAVSASKFEISWEYATRAAEYTVQYSNDGTTWTDVPGANYEYGTEGANGASTDIVTFTSTTAKYFRINMTKAQSGKGVYCPKVYEVIIRGETVVVPADVIYDDTDNTARGITANCPASLIADVDSIVDKNGNALTGTDLVATGAVITVGSKEYTVVIKGDVNGDGKIGTADFLMVRDAYLQKLTISGANLKAACISGGTAPSTADFLRIRDHYLGKTDIYAA